MNIDIKKILPKDPSSFNGFRAIRVLTALYLLVAVVRSCIHLFAEDGGAESIAGVDTSVAGGDNIIAIFHQWGAIQLILALLLSLLFFRYPTRIPMPTQGKRSSHIRKLKSISRRGTKNSLFVRPSNTHEVEVHFRREFPVQVKRNKCER